METKIIDRLKGGTDALAVGAKADIVQVILEAAFGIARCASGQGRQQHRSQKQLCEAEWVSEWGLPWFHSPLQVKAGTVLYV